MDIAEERKEAEECFAVIMTEIFPKLIIDTKAKKTLKSYT
jgi:hypothetical protein